MKKKIILIVLILIIVAAGFIGYLFLQREREISKLPDYYQDLAKGCKEKEGFSCCISSVKTMAAHNSKLKPETGCAEGLQVSQLKCVGSYVWCGPIFQEESEISEWPDYYQVIARECKEKPSYECCMGGLTDMVKNNYLLADEDGNCPEGFKANMNWCKDTLIWCEPIK